MDQSKKPSVKAHDELLYNQKAHLVEQIQTMHNDSDMMVGYPVDVWNPYEYARLSDLLEEYNALVDALLGRRLRFDPLTVLPEELWRMIILESVSRKAGSKGDDRRYNESRMIISLDLVLSLTLVSKAWGDAILSNPIFWTEISLLDHYYAENGPARTQLCLHLSQGAPISLHLDSSCILADTFPIILSMKHRIKEIHLRDINGRVMGILDGLSPFPLLTSIEAEYRDFALLDTRCILLHNPTIESVTGLDIQAIIISSEQTPNLREFETYDAFESVAEASKHSNLPMDIRFHHIDSYDSSFGTNTDPKIILEESSLLPWKFVTHTRSDFRTKWLRRLPSLVKLQAQIPFDELGSLASFLPDLSKLDYLAVIIPKFKFGAILSSPNLVSANIRKAPSVHTLHLQVNTSDHGEGTACGEALSELFGQIMPSVTTLSITIPSTDDLAHWINAGRFPSVRRISFNWNGSVSTVSKSITLSPSVEAVEVFSWSALPDWASVSITSLKTVGFLDPVTIRESTFNLDGLHSLTKLSTDHHELISWRSLCLPYLQVLKLKVRHLRPDDSLTRFCCELALSPSNLPSLCELSFGGCPEIDILFIMLERRNLHQTKAVSKIGVLVLPTRCPPFYYKALRDVVQGKFVQRPSNFDLSLAGNIVSFRDLAIPGCVLCHRALKSCSHPVNVLENALGFTPISYPWQSIDIIKSWVDRSYIWNALNHGRDHACDKFYGRITISVNSPDICDMTN